MLIDKESDQHRQVAIKLVAYVNFLHGKIGQLTSIKNILWTIGQSYIEACEKIKDVIYNLEFQKEENEDGITSSIQKYKRK